MCCIATDVIHDGDRRMNLHVDSLEEIWHSPALTEARAALIADQPVRECARCNHYQANSGGELRSWVNTRWDERFALDRTIADLAARPGAPRGPRPNEYQLNLGPLCNLKCRMCGTRYSSRIAEDPVFAKWADDYHADTNEVGRWRGDRLSLLPRYVLGAKYTGFGNGVWANDRSFHRDLVGPASISMPSATDHVPSKLEIHVSKLNAVPFLGTVSLNGRLLRRSEWFPGRQVVVELPADALVPGGNIELELQAVSAKTGPTGAGFLVEDLILHRTRTGAAGRTRNERAFLRHAEGEAWYDDEAILAELMADPTSLTRLILQGGEPMLIPATEWVIDRLIEAGTASETTLQFVTNATIFKPQLIEKLRRFRQVEMVCSIDGVGSVFEYIRNPARWAEVAEIIERYRTLSFIDIEIAVAAQAYNLFDIANILSYFDARKIPVGLHFLVDPVRLNVLALPPPVRERAIERLESYLAECGDAANRGVAAFVIDHLRSNQTKIIPNQLDDLFAFTNDLDDVNGHSIHRACPELASALAECGHPWGVQRRFSAMPAVAQ